MKQKISIILPFLLFSLTAGAQIIDTGSMWTWIKGASTTNQPAVTTPPASATPGSRQYSMGWTDKDGNFWVFGGRDNTNDRYSDLWKFEPGAGNLWTLVKGVTTFNALPDYGNGTPGASTATTTPGGRYGAAAWTDKNGDFWLFGGSSPSNSGLKNDLWRYSVSTNQWVYVAGPKDTFNTGSYGTKGTPAPTNWPGARGQERSASWVDNDGNFWLFGGQGYIPKRGFPDGFPGVYLNDLWRYNPTTGIWTWVSGSDSFATPGVYGTQGTAAPANTPGARLGAGYWVDKDGNFWLFGGLGHGKVAGAARLNDLWKFDPNAMQWTWVNGPDTANTAGNYGQRGVTAASNLPGARWISQGWTDDYGNLWLFGGNGFGKNKTSLTAPANVLNDLWKYNIQDNRWTWMKGMDTIMQTGIYGSTPSPANAPGGRGQGLSWKDTSGNFWVFGGNGLANTITVGRLNDMWRLGTVLPPAPAQPGAFTTSKQQVCPGETNVTYTVPAVAYASSYEWQYITGSGVTFSPGNLTTQPTNNLSFSTAATSGTLRVRGKNAGGDGPWRDLSITVQQAPTLSVSPTGAQSVCQGDSLRLSATATGVTYQWRRGTTPVGTAAFYDAKDAGSYTVTVTSTATSCTTTSSPVTVSVSTPPTLTVTPTGTVSVCDGDSILLSATSSGVTYEWKRGTTTVGAAAAYAARDAGSYTVTVTGISSNCAVTSAPVTVSVNPRPVATVTAGGPVHLCTGGSVTLTAATGANYNYQWKQGTTPVGSGSNTYTAQTTGDYRVVVTNTATNCKDSSSPLRVTVYSRPAVTLVPGDTAFCEGGIVTLNVSTTDTALTYRWKKGTATIPLAVAHFLEINETGSYTVVVGRQHAAGCEDTTNAVNVTVHPLPVIAVTWDGIYLHATSGYNGYQWYTGTQAIAGATDSVFRPSANGVYSVVAEGQNGCSGSSQITTLNNVSISTAGAQSSLISVYPNPVQEMLYINAPFPVSVRLSTMEGRLLIHQTDAQALPVRNYAAGLYLLQVLDQDGILIRTDKILKKD